MDAKATARQTAGTAALRIISAHGIEAGTLMFEGAFEALTRALVAVAGIEHVRALFARTAGGIEVNSAPQLCVVVDNERVSA